MNLNACNLMICLAVSLLVGPSALAAPGDDDCLPARGAGFLEMMAWRDGAPAERYGGPVWLTVEACGAGPLSCEASNLLTGGPLGPEYAASVTETAEGRSAAVTLEGERYDQLREDPVYENDCTAFADASGLSVTFSFSVQSDNGALGLTGSASGHALDLY